MRLQANCCLDIAMGVAAEIETSKIQGRGAFLHNRVIRIEKARKETKKTYERPRRMDAAMIAIPRKNAMTDVLPGTSRKSVLGLLGLLGFIGLLGLLGLLGYLVCWVAWVIALLGLLGLLGLLELLSY